MPLRNRIICIALFFGLAPTLQSQTLIKSDDGKDILLNSDGTWDNVTVTTLDDGTKVALKDNGKYVILNGKHDDNSGIGTGEFDESGNGIFGRKVTYVNRAKLSGVMNGIAVGQNRQIWVKTCINKAGKVTYVELDENNTNVVDNSVLKKALALVSTYEFEPNVNAPREQCGIIKIKIDRTNNHIGN